jgi:hypothetical protein
VKSGNAKLVLKNPCKPGLQPLPVEVRFKNRVCFTGAVVLGQEVLLGAIPMEDMDIIIIPKTRMVDVNPANPNYASASVKGARNCC